MRSKPKRAHPYWGDSHKLAWWNKRHYYLRMFTGMIGRVLFGLLIALFVMVLTFCTIAEVLHYGGEEVPCRCTES